MSQRTVIAAPPTAPWHRPPPGEGLLIGVAAPSYSMERVSYMIPSVRHRYVTLKTLTLRRFERRGSFFALTPWLAGPRVDLVHTFNHIPVNRRFVVTAELEMPRYLGEVSARRMRFGLAQLASDRCRRILALTEAAQARLVRRFTDAGLPELCTKLEVFRGAVHPGPAGGDRRQPNRDGPLRLMFVGGDGLRKGLGPVVAAARLARAAGIELTLTVIGGPTADCYVAPGLRVDPAPLLRALQDTPWITHHPALPNAEVRRLMLEHDLFLLPSMDESLGWVPAEAALAGMPSVVTNIFALPELVRDTETGWILPLPLNADRRWQHFDTPQAVAEWPAAEASIRDGILRILCDHGHDRTRLHAMGQAARHHIESLYSFAVAEPQIHAIYRAAL